MRAATGANQTTGAERAIEPRRRPHGQDLRHAAPFFADQPGGRTSEFDLRAGVGLVAQLVF